MALFVEADVRARAKAELKKSFNLEGAVQLVKESTEAI